MDDRSSWESLTAQVIPLIKQLTQAEEPKRRLTIVAESFGGCLAFRLALAVPDLIANMVVVNSATCFDKSYSGIVNLIAASNLLSLFPQQLYQVTPSWIICLGCWTDNSLQQTLCITGNTTVAALCSACTAITSLWLIHAKLWDIGSGLPPRSLVQ